MRIFSFCPPLILVEEEKWFSGVSSFQTTNSVFNITDENNSFSVTIPGHWISKTAEKTFDKLNKLLDLRSQHDIELQNYMLNKKGKKGYF